MIAEELPVGLFDVPIHVYIKRMNGDLFEVETSSLSFPIDLAHDLCRAYPDVFTDPVALIVGGEDDASFEDEQIVPVWNRPICEACQQIDYEICHIEDIEYHKNGAVYIDCHDQTIRYADSDLFHHDEMDSLHAYLEDIAEERWDRILDALQEWINDDPSRRVLCEKSCFLYLDTIWENPLTTAWTDEDQYNHRLYARYSPLFGWDLYILSPLADIRLFGRSSCEDTMIDDHSLYRAIANRYRSIH